MGHYRSEMQGEPFYTVKKSDDFELAKKILNYKKLSFKKIVELRIEWVTDDPSRIWYEVVYEPKLKSNCNYITTMNKDEADFLKIQNCEELSMSALTKPLDTIDYQVYRNKLEKVTEQRKAQINLYSKNIEIIQDYSFEPYKPEPDDVDFKKFAVFIPKEGCGIELTTAWHESDPEKVTNPVIYIHTYGTLVDTIRLEHEKEAAKIYTKLKNWLINE